MKRVIVGGIVVLLAAGAFLWSPLGTREFFRQERKWNALEGMEPFLRTIGVLRPVRIQVERGFNLLLDPRDLVPLTILKTREWQPEVWRSVSPVLSEGSVFFDVGAHIGYFSMKAAVQVGKTGRVVSFEPNPEILKQLRDNVAANHFQNVIVEPIACTDRDQMLTLYAAPIVNTGASSLAKQNAEISAIDSPRGYLVRGRPIDDVVRELGLTRVDAIKIDVEGAEVIVLRGAINTLRQFHPKLAVEVIARQLASFQTTPDDLRALLESAGYNLSRPLNAEETDWEWSRLAMASKVQMADKSAEGQLIRGFYGAEDKSWRWTAGKFTVALKPPEGSREKGAWLVMDFVIPEAGFDKMKGVTVAANTDGAALAPASFTTQGKHTYRAEVPPSALTKNAPQVNFSLDRVLSASQYGRELGLVVTAVGLESK
ncbi:MAG TPA: FkbM family methyltransferase [Bryobacteraceae bacterium]|nr:FkbM family methyltransferase [Bryobacteraceae bacterium]